jgi:hypothetical protein
MQVHGDCKGFKPRNTCPYQMKELSQILTSLMTKVVGATNIILLITENLPNRLVIILIPPHYKQRP